jgi:Carboxypeptidase regulatory-like domain
MRVCVRTCLVLACLIAAQSTAWAQATIAGAVKDSSGAVLPGVTVEAASPALIEKVRTTATDGAGRYRIEDLRPGTYVVTFTLPGFVTVRRDGVLVSGTGVIAIDSELRVGGVQETVTVTGETPVVDIQSTKREVTLDNETMRALPSVRAYSYLLTTVPGLQTNVNNVSTGPVFAIFPIHGGRGVESRVTVEGLNISNPPGGNQPPNYTADIGNAQEVTMTTSGGLGETETAGLTLNIVPKQGGNRLSGLFFVSGFSEGMQSDNFTDELKTRGATQPAPTSRVYDVNFAGGGPIVKDRLWYYMSVRAQGSRQNILNVFYNQNAGNPNAWTYVPDFSKPAYYDRTWENYTPRITWQASSRNKFSFSWDEQPVCRSCTGTASFSGSPAAGTTPEADGHGEFSPQRVQTGRWTAPMTNRLLLEAGFGTTYYQWAGKELDPNPTRDLVRVVNLNQVISPPGLTPFTQTTTFRSQHWWVNKTRGTTWNAAASYVTGSHSIKVGYQGNHWIDDRELNTNTQHLQYTFTAGVPSSITMYASPYNVNARAMATSLYAQDQWTVSRLTLQGAIRYDNPWSWFPETVQPASTYFPGATFPKTDGVTGYRDITPRLGAAYDIFGNGKTALKVNLGKYLQGASVSNLAYNANPALRIVGGGGGIFPPSVNRTWGDANGNFVPDCVLTNLALNGECGATDLRFGSTQLIGSVFDEALFSGWGVRPSDWALGVSIQQELFPRASVEVGYHRRSFSMFQTGGTVNDNQSIGPNDVLPYSITVPNDPRLPNVGASIGPLYNTNPNVFNTGTILVRPTKDVGEDTRVFNGVDVTFNLRSAKGITFSGGTSTGKVENNWCEIRAAVPESFLLNPYCNVASPWQTALRGLVAYTIPRIDLQLSSVIQDKANVGTEQLGSIAANYTLTAADQAAAAAQIGRTLTATGPITVNLLAGGQLYGARVRQWDLAAKKIIRFGGQRLTVGADFYNLLNNNVTLGFSGGFVPNAPGWQSPTTYMNPRVFRLNAEFAF